MLNNNSQRTETTETAYNNVQCVYIFWEPIVLNFEVPTASGNPFKITY
jgi:hypothetical protein